VAKSGDTVEVVVSATADRDPSGAVVALLVASKDVTERNRAERQLRAAFEENARLREELERERDYLREEVQVSMNFGRIIGESPSLQKMLARLEAVAQTSASVLIQGESGVGKELVAHVIHARSPRSQGPLVKVNCASIPHELFESEFFGHVKGAFTGAHRDRVGRFQLADGGTIFLDEVGEIPLDLQSKLLRVLQESEYERVGDDRTHSVDVRVIAATNRDLERAVADGKFREDLYYRLSVFPIDVPPLRERGDDVVQLASHFLERTCQQFGHRPLTLSKQQAALLKRYDWPGNIRELKNVIERAVILSRGKVLRLDLAMSDILNPVVEREDPSEPTGGTLLTEAEIQELERKNMILALELAQWRVSGPNGAAKMLGVKPTTLADRMRKLRIAKPRTAAAGTG
jgi:transcriptional regulator with GAF, ATPase, and Fis domain